MDNRLVFGGFLKLNKINKNILSGTKNKKFRIKIYYF